MSLKNEFEIRVITEEILCDFFDLMVYSWVIYGIFGVDE